MEVKQPAKNSLNEYKNLVIEKLSSLRKIFALAAIGDFSQDIQIPEKEDEFTETFVGIQIMIEVIREKIAELHLELEEKTAILAGIGEGLIITGSRGEIQFINQATKDAFGWGKDDKTSQPLVSLIDLETKDGRLLKAADRPMTLALKKAKKVSGEYFYVRPNGHKIPVHLTVTPLIVRKNVVGIIEIFRDITKEKELEKIKDEFVSVASHEIRTPLAAVKGLSSMLLKGQYGSLTADLKHPIKNIYNSTERMAHLVNDMLSVSRIRTGRLNIVITSFNLKKVIEHVLLTMEPLLGKKKIALRSEEIVDLEISSDREKVIEILDNLVSNAIKFTDKGEIVLSVKKAGQMIEISVKDSGTGIAPKDQAKLFEEFSQTKEARVRSEGSLGVGLFISKQLARKLGGDVKLVKSALGQGSVFALSLPLRHASSG